MAVEVVVELAEQRRDRQPRQTVIAAGNIRAQIAGFLQHDGGGEREHQQRQAAVAQQEPAGNEADQRRHQRCSDQARHRLAPTEPRDQQADRIGADAEERRVPERDDAGIAENEIERERKHHHDQHLAAESHAVGENKKSGDREQPRQRLRPAEAVPAHQIFGGALARGDTLAAFGLTRGHKTPQA